MKILLANPRGFCAGVNMAIECVNRVLALRGPPIYVFHEIVHNRHVVADFKDRGVLFVNDLADVPPGAVVVFSAHGISPAIRRQASQRQLVEIDATCPLVTKVHNEVIRFAREGYTVVFVGHRNHDEAVGTVGEAPEAILVVESPEEVQPLRPREEAKVAYVTQTTLSVADAARTVEALRARWSNIQGPARGDICYATTNRQRAVSAWSGEADLVLVVGSHNSSNSRRLVETAQAAGRPAHLIDDDSHLEQEWFDDVGTVMVTAGASAPENLVRRLLDRLCREYGGEVEERLLVEEDVSFEPPRSLAKLSVVGGAVR
jgi:4-hydroxy-3-methylbut-2-en-1-yl diphosphate reductase